MKEQIDSYKELAARAAVEHVKSDMVVGLGHGSTMYFALLALSEKLKSDELSGLVGIPASSQSEALAKELDITLGEFNEHVHIDIMIDGADEVDPQFNLIKGGGGALLREKMLAQASQRVVIIVDESKLSPVLGTNFALPLEVAPFGWKSHLGFISDVGGQAKLRLGDDGEPILSDQRNFLLDCRFPPISDPKELAQKLEGRSGILEHGLFLTLATDVIVAGPDGVQHHKAKK